MANIFKRVAAAIRGDVSGGWYNESIQDRVSMITPGTAITKDVINQHLSSARMGMTEYRSALCSEMRTTDVEVGSKMNAVESFLCQAPMEILPYPLDQRALSASEKNLSKDAASYARDQLLDPDLDVDTAKKAALWGLFCGESGVRVIAAPGKGVGGREKLVSLTTIPAERFRWMSDSPSLGVRTTYDMSKIVPVDELGDGIAVMIADPDVGQRDRAGLARALFGPWLTRKYGIEWWARDVENFSAPFRFAHYPVGNEKRRRELILALSQMANTGVGVFPDGVDVEFLKGFDVAGKSQAALMDYIDRTISKQLLGTADVTQVRSSGGSQNSSNDQKATTEIYLDAMGRDISIRFFRAQIVRPLIRRNMGEEVSSRFTPLVGIRVRSYDDLKTFFEAMDKAVDVGTGVPVTWVHGRTGIPVPEKDEEILKKKAPPTPIVVGPGGVPGEKTPPVPGEKPAPGGNVVPFPKDQKSPQGGASVRHGMSAAVPSSPATEALLTRLEDAALQHAPGSGNAVIAPYVKIIEEVKRDGGDLGHLAARIRIQAQMMSKDPRETSDLIASVLTVALLEGFTAER